MKFLADLIAKHGRACLFMSSGKDGRALLELVKPHWGDIIVTWVDSGASHPRTSEYMEGIASMVPHFVRIASDQPGDLRLNGWPADVLPAWSTASGQISLGNRGLRFQPAVDCCSRNLWQPIGDFIAREGFTLLLTGQKRSEKYRNHYRNELINKLGDMVVVQPLNEYTDDQIFGFLKSRDIPFPPFYEEGATSSGDCWNCTAYLDANAGRIRWMKRAEPERYQVIMDVLLELDAQIKADSFTLKHLTFESQYEHS